MVRASSDRESDHRRKSSAKKLLHAHEFCSITGVSNETLRHYVDKGIILPAAIAPNNYKMYSERNVIDMLLARSCRGLDLSIGAILEKMNASVADQEEIFAAHERKIEAEIASLQLKLARIQQQREILASIPASLGKVKERQAEEMFNLYRLMLFGEGASESPDAQRILNQWMRYPQYICVALSVPREILIDSSVDALPISVGVGVREEWAIALGLDLRPPVSFFPGERNLFTVVETNNPFGLRKSDLNGIFDKAQSMKVEIASDLTGLLCTYTETQKGRIYYISLGFSIK